jgi:uncharacterized protein
MLSSDVHTLRRALDALPIFPLPNAVLLPHAPLPLHVFEPRYQALVADALAGDRLLAIALLEPGWEDRYEQRPPVRPVAGLGEIVAHDPLPDGRSNILIRGLSRIEIVREHPPRQLYRVVQARLLRDRRPRRDLRDDHAALLALCNRVAEHLPAEHAAMLRQVASGEPDPGVACDLLGAALLGDTGAKQALLERRDVGERLRKLTAEVAALASRLCARPEPN